MDCKNEHKFEDCDRCVICTKVQVKGDTDAERWKSSCLDLSSSYAEVRTQVQLGTACFGQPPPHPTPMAILFGHTRLMLASVITPTR